MTVSLIFGPAFFGIVQLGSMTHFLAVCYNSITAVHEDVDNTAIGNVNFVDKVPIGGGGGGGAGRNSGFQLSCVKTLYF